MSGLMRNLPKSPLVSLSRSNASQVAKPLYKNQANLQKLPVPALKPALEKYVKSLEPLLTPEEFEKSKKCVEEFQKPGGIGEILHKRLIERSNSLPQGWLIDWWNEYAYFGYRDPVVINVNYFFQFQDDPRCKTQTRRAATIIQGALKYRDLVVSEQLEPELFKGKPMCMSQYKYMFNTCRIPLPNVDTTEYHDPHGNNFVCVMRKNQFFTFNLTKEGNVPLSTTEIEHQLERIKRIADVNGKELPIGSLTVANRDVFAETRQKILSLDPKNKESLSAIEKSVFVVCLDDTSPTGHNDTGRELWHGDGRNRFFDKALQFIVFENGKAGFNGEHSKMDGTPTFQLCDFVMDNLLNNKVDHGSPIVGDLPEPQKLGFVVNKEIEQTINESLKKFDETVLQHDHNVLAFHDYGKETIKKFKMSPDAFVQMSIQLAYYKMFGKVRSTYESAQTRKYLNGRTEVCRSVSKESSDWVKSMVTPKPDSERLALLKKAVQSQVNYMNDAVDANGCDRVLLGMRKLCRPDEKPSIFQDKGYQVSSHWNLSTSQITSEYFDGYGWGEVVPDGFGIAYMVKNNSIHYNVANLREFSSSLKLCQHLRDSLLEMKRICEAEAPASKL